MNKIHFQSFVLLILFSITVNVAYSQDLSMQIKDGNIIYIKDNRGNRVIDFSHCGYMNSNIEIPSVENIVFVPFQNEDASDIIQKAINDVEKLPINKKGFRGAILIDEGEFLLSKSLRISKSGVVLRGSGKKATSLRKIGVLRDALIYIEGVNDIVASDTTSVVSKYVPVNSLEIEIESIENLKAGDEIFIVRPSTTEWIKQIGCDHFGGGITALGWKEGDIDLKWKRRIDKIKGNSIFIDAPLTMPLNIDEASSKVIKYSWDGLISNVGIENLSLISDYDTRNTKDEDHSWTGVSVNNAANCWIRQLSFSHFAGSAVILQSESSNITVEDCISLDPISEIGGMRRRTFLTMGQHNLFQRCYSENGINDFAAGYSAAGPNAFVQCETYNSLGFSGAIDSWSCGLLFDIVNIDGHNLTFKNLGQNKNGAGWGTGNSLFWQSTASEIECYSPGDDIINRAYGCWAQFSGDGEWAQSNSHIQPRSIFYYQLGERLGKDVEEQAKILKMNTNATSSPTVEQALELTQEASQSKLTLRQWIESQSLDVVNNTSKIAKVSNNKKPIKSADNKTVSELYKIINGKISFKNKLLVGGKSDIQWWNGKLRPRNINSSSPHVTRFVPDQEGLGLTDRIDSVVTFMENNNRAVLDHNYGLWYERRRDDHERIRRRDGDVWGPFYEQPFARSGEGVAWDGLSKYDLTKPNKWYWARLNQFATKGYDKGIMLFHQNYFQHNIIEAGAHWVDSPWRTVNNINSTDFPEPVNFAGDKRIFYAEMFYDIDNPSRRELHKQYIRQCLDAFNSNDNVVQLISAEYTGPLHFVQFWIDEIAGWEKDTGKNALVALSTTKDVQDAILADPARSAIVDIIDIRYWHYKDNGELYAPEGGKSMAPRQFARKMKVGKTSFSDVFKAVSEYREKYPDKAVVYYAQKYPELAWAILMGGGSLPAISNISDLDFLSDVTYMNPVKTNNINYYQLANSDIGSVIYFAGQSEDISVKIEPGKYQVMSINEKTGAAKVLYKKLDINEDYKIDNSVYKHGIIWFKRIDTTLNHR